MNNDKIKACFDAISPDKEQKERMLSAVLKRTEERKLHIRPYRYISLAAAFFLTLTGLYYAIDNGMLSPDKSTPELVAKTDMIAEIKTDIPIASDSENILREGRINSYSTTDVKSPVSDKSDAVSSAPPNTDNSLPLAEDSGETDIINGSMENDSDASDMNITYKTESKPTSGGGGGSSGGAKNYSLDELLSMDEYSPYIPTETAEGFYLSRAVIYGESLNLTYISDADIINIRISRDKQNKPSLTLEEIRGINTDTEQISITLSMGEYIADVDAPSILIEEIYMMFKSCGYFN